MTTAEHDDRLDQVNRARQRRMAHRSHGLVELLERRPDLYGVHDPADLVAEAVRWSA